MCEGNTSILYVGGHYTQTQRKFEQFSTEYHNFF